MTEDYQIACECDGCCKQDGGCTEPANVGGKFCSDCPCDGHPESAQSIINEAVQIVEGPRQRDYDSPGTNFDRITAMWSVILGHPVTRRQFTAMMVTLKLARDVKTSKRDNLVDIVGYIHAYDLAGDES